MVAPDFREPFERKATGFANPGAQENLVLQGSGSFVVDLVSDNDPGDGLLCFRAGDRPPMCSGNILHPTQINGVVHVILLVDVTGQN